MRVLLTSVVVIMAAMLLGGCGDSGASQDEITEARKQGAAKERQQQRLKSLEKQLRTLQRSGTTQGSVSGGGSGSEGCAGGIVTNSVTTCGFAENVKRDYFEQVGSGSGIVYSFSPTTGRTYEMFCAGGSPHECVGGNDAFVSFP